MSQGRTILVKAEGNAELIRVENFEGTTFKELQEFATQINFTRNVRVTLRASNTDLVDDNAFIPLDDNVIIFVTVDKMDGGSEYSDLKDAVKAIIAKEGGKAKAHFGKFHMLSKAKLQAAIDAYTSTGAIAAPAVEVAEEVTEEVEETPATAEGVNSVNDLPEMAAARAAYGGMMEATETMLGTINKLGKVIFPSAEEEVFGGVTLSRLNAEFEAAQAVSKSRRRK